MQYPAVEKLQYSEVLTQRYGFVEEGNGARAMSPARLAAQLRELTRASPTLLLRALDNPDRVAFEGGVRFGQGMLPAISFRDGAHDIRDHVRPGDAFPGCDQNVRRG